MGETELEGAGTHDGGCACGYVRYRMKAQPLIVHCCHCSWCQRQTGSAFAVNALIEAGHVELLLGELVKVELPSPSGKKQKIARCPRCQVAVWSNYLVMPNGIAELIVFIRVGTLDAPSKFPPDIHIYASSRQPWVVLPPGSQAVQEYYVTEKVWSQESLARRAALLVAAPG